MVNPLHRIGLNLNSHGYEIGIDDASRTLKTRQVGMLPGFTRDIVIEWLIEPLTAEALLARFDDETHRLFVIEYDLLNESWLEWTSPSELPDWLLMLNGLFYGHCYVAYDDAIFGLNMQYDIEQGDRRTVFTPQPLPEYCFHHLNEVVIDSQLRRWPGLFNIALFDDTYWWKLSPDALLNWLNSEPESKQEKQASPRYSKPKDMPVNGSSIPYRVASACHDLGIEPTLDHELIKKAWRQLAKQYHPDRVGEDADKIALFKDYNNAYEVIDKYFKDINNARETI